MESLFNLSDITCRICLQNNESSNSLYDEVEYEEPIILMKLLQLVANVVVPNDEISPTRICSICTEKLLNAYDFICSVKKSEKFLNDYVQDESEVFATSAVKDEFIPEENQNVEVLDEDFELFLDVDEEEEEKVEGDMNFLEISSEDISEVEVKLTEIDQRERQQKSKSKSPSFVVVNIANDQPSQDNSRTTFAKCKYNCEKCQRSFAKKETLQRHVKKAHTFIGTDKSAVQSNVIQCSHCPRTFAREDTLHRHELAMHAEKDDVVKEYQLKHTYKHGLCPYCGESFSQASLIIHIRRHTGENPYKCDECEKGFPRRQDLMIHKRHHTGERPHSCSICGKSFIRPNKLARHLRVHTGQRPYKCTECDKGFAQSNDLKIHMRRHTGEKPYKCNICGLGFICGAALKSHRRSKGHVEDSVADDVDPYANSRVNNRTGKQLVQLVNFEHVEDEEILQD